MDLFDHALRERMQTEAPLAARMRPRTLDEFIGQDEIVGEGRLLRRAIAADRLFSSMMGRNPGGIGRFSAGILAQNLAGNRLQGNPCAKELCNAPECDPR
jgi:putative ATPase